MTSYLFRTACEMKHYNCDKWYIMRDYVKNIIINSESIKNALEQYRKILNDKYCISVSDNAMKRKEPIYGDESETGCAIQTGYILTGKTGFESRSYNIPYTEQYIEVWVTINTIANPFE